MQAEIEKVKKRREERAIEKAQHEEEMVHGIPLYLKSYFLKFVVADRICVSCSFFTDKKTIKKKREKFVCFVQVWYSLVILLFLQALLARERARAEFQDWEKKEEEV